MQTELVISIFTFVAVASGFYFTTKSRLDKIEKDLSDYRQTSIEISNYFTSIEELFKDITRNVEIIKNQHK
jgi:hypothetical protein